MSTNISEIMFEMEQAGISQARVNQIVLELLMAGQRTIFAQRTEEARRRLVAHEGGAGVPFGRATRDAG